MESTNMNWYKKKDFFKCGDLVVSSNLKSFGLTCDYCEAFFLRLRPFINHVNKFHNAEMMKSKPDEKIRDPLAEENEFEYYNSLHDEDSEILDCKIEIIAPPMNENKNENFSYADYVDNVEQDYMNSEDHETDSSFEIEGMTVQRLPELQKFNEYIGDGNDFTLEIDLNAKKNYNLLTHIIKGFCENACLWDSDHIDFSNKHLKQQTMRTLKESIEKRFNLEITETIIQQIFVELRNLYIDELKCINESKDRQDKITYTPKLWCFHQLNFLRNIKDKPDNFSTSTLSQISNIYKEYPALWDLSNATFRDRSVRDNAMHAMLSVVNNEVDENITVHQLILIIRSIRKYYMDNQRHLINCMQKNKSFEPPYPQYYEILQYLNGSVGPFYCAECNFQTYSYDTYQVHLCKHENRSAYVCQFCQKVFKTSVNLKIHIRSHTGETPYHCKDCERRFTSSSTLRTHQRTHSGVRPYICDVCGKTFRANSTFLMHKKYHEPSSFEFACSICPKKYGEKKKLREHMNSHLNRREHVCLQCGKGFFARKTLRQHEQLHSAQKQHKCHLCPKEFAQRTGLHSHLRIQHKLQPVAK